MLYMIGAVFSKILQSLGRDETFMNNTMYNKILNNQNTKCVVKICAVDTRDLASHVGLKD